MPFLPFLFGWRTSSHVNSTSGAERWWDALREVLLASPVPADVDLSAAKLRVLAVLAGEDPVVSYETQEVKDSFTQRSPAGTRVTVIQGGGHCG